MTWEPAIFPIGSMSVRISGSTIGEVKLLVLSSVQLNTPLLPSGLINILSRALETGLFDVELDVFLLTLEIEAGSGVAVGAGFIVGVGDFMSPGEVLWQKGKEPEDGTNGIMGYAEVNGLHRVCKNVEDAQAGDEEEAMYVV